MHRLLVALLMVTSFKISGVKSIQCYQCNYLNNENATSRLCWKFDYSSRYIVDCPYSTMCMKKEFYMNLLNGEQVHMVLRDCAMQTHEYYDMNRRGGWEVKKEIQEPYQEGCLDIDNKGAKVTSSRQCYCRYDLCNGSPGSSLEGYTDIMGVIVVFNLMKYIRSIR